MAARFIKHEPCPSCGSRDNLGRYSDGAGYCFGCGYVERSAVSGFVSERTVEDVDDEEDRVVMPTTATAMLPQEAVQWLAKYDISVPEAIRLGYRWEPELYQLLFPLYDEDNKLVCIQARNFSEKLKKRAKYYNIGDKSTHHTIFGKGAGDLLVMTEDIVSSAKIGRQCCAYPLLGTSITKEKLALLACDYKELIVWLDEDKWKEACAIADAAKLLGVNAFARFTPLDPKEYSDAAIARLLE